MLIRSQLDRQTRRLDVKIRDLVRQGIMPKDPPLPSLLGSTGGQTGISDPSASNSGLSTPLGLVSGNGLPSTTIANSNTARLAHPPPPLSRTGVNFSLSGQLGRSSLSGLHVTSSAPATPAASVHLTQRQQQRESSAGAVNDAKRRRLNGHLGTQQSASSALARQSSVGPGGSITAPKAGTPSSVRSGSLGPRKGGAGPRKAGHEFAGGTQYKRSTLTQKQQQQREQSGGARDSSGHSGGQGNKKSSGNQLHNNNKNNNKKKKKKKKKKTRGDGVGNGTVSETDKFKAIGGNRPKDHGDEDKERRKARKEGHESGPGGFVDGMEVDDDDDDNAVSIKRLKISNPQDEEVDHDNDNEEQEDEGEGDEVEEGEGDEEIVDGDSDDRKYCICRNVSYGNMVACDNDDCPYEWFHWQCVGMTKEPIGTWYCPECGTKRDGKRLGTAMAVDVKAVEGGGVH